MENAHERLAVVRVALGFDKKADFAAHVGIERSTYDKMEKGPHKPSADNLEKIAKRFPEINLNWVLLGSGPMLFQESDGRTLSQLPPAVPSEAKPRREGLPATPGTATPQEADFVGRLIQRLENELEDSKRREEQQQRMIETLLGKSPASAYAATPVEPRQQIQGFRTAATLAPEGKVIAMWAPIQLEEAA